MSRAARSPAQRGRTRPFADELIGVQVAQDLTHAIGQILPAEPLTRLNLAPDQLSDLALRQRADLLRDALLADVPGDYANLARVVRDAAAGSASFEGWAMWPVTAAVADKAVADGQTAAFDDAMDLLAELTGRLSSEFAIRTLLRHDLDRALAIIRNWTRTADAHVRRLASEGTRPYLPWAVRVPELLSRPGATVPILDALYRDSHEYVRRSVANHLNDLSRDHVGLVAQTAAGWLADSDENTAWVVRHGLRTLIKRGDREALALLGFTVDAGIDVDGPQLDRDRVAVGEEVEFRATIRNTGDRAVQVALDYVVHHRKSNGTQAPKTFKLRTATMQPGECIELRRSHSFRPITTRRYYPGPHAIALQINGVSTDPVTFELADT